MKKSVSRSQLKNINKKPSELKDQDGRVMWNPDPEGRLESAMNEDGEAIYIRDGKEMLSHGDAWGMLTGREKIIPRSRFSYAHISQERWDAIFNKE